VFGGCCGWRCFQLGSLCSWFRESVVPRERFGASAANRMNPQKKIVEFDFHPCFTSCLTRRPIGAVPLTDKDLAQRWCAAMEKHSIPRRTLGTECCSATACALPAIAEDAFDYVQTLLLKPTNKLVGSRIMTSFLIGCSRIARNFCISLYREKKNFPRQEPDAGGDAATGLENLLSEDLQVRIGQRPAFRAGGTSPHR